MTYHTTARADARALGVGLAIGAAVGLVLGGAYFAGGLAQAADAKAKSERMAHAAPPPSSNMLAQASIPAAASAVGKPSPAAYVTVKPAEPFRMAASVTVNPRRELDCLADAVYYEARGETAAGQAAIAQVVLNRVRHPAFPKSVCGVVFQGAGADGCQFSFVCNGAMRQPKDRQAWARAEQIAARALAGVVIPQVGQATHFHATSVRPDWGPSLMRVAQVGLHVFYRFGHASAPSSYDEAPVSITASDKPHALYASMIPGIGGDLRPAAPAGVPAAAAQSVSVTAAPTAVAKTEADTAAPKPTEIASAS